MGFTLNKTYTMFNILRKIFGTRSERILQAYQARVEEINGYGQQLIALTNDQLREKTGELRSEIKKKLDPIRQEVAALQKRAHESSDLQKKGQLFKQSDEKKDVYQREHEAILHELLPRSFAIMKETARRFKENPILEVTATDYDRELSEQHDHITLQDDVALWKNQWTAAGVLTTWDMVHYDVQLIGGMILHEGKIAEMATGEGKTLVSTLPIFLNALSGETAHLVTVNDYLARQIGRAHV